METYRPTDDKPQAAPVQRGAAPWAETGRQPDPVPVRKLACRKVFALLKRVVALEFAEKEEPCPGRVRLVLDVDMGATADDGLRIGYCDHLSPAEELASLSAGLGLVLRRNARSGEDLMLLTAEEAQWLRHKRGIDKAS